MQFLARRESICGYLIAFIAGLSVTVTIILSSSGSASAQTDKFDGKWRSKGELLCGFGGNDTFEAVITILNLQLSGTLKGQFRDYDITGTMDLAGRLSSGHLVSGQLKYGGVFNAVGKFDTGKGKITFSGAAGGNIGCGGDITLVRLGGGDTVAEDKSNKASDSDHKYCRRNDGSVSQLSAHSDCALGTEITKLEYDRVKRSPTTTSSESQEEIKIPGTTDTVEASLIRIKNLLDRDLITAEDAKIWRRELLGLSGADSK